MNHRTVARWGAIAGVGAVAFLAARNARRMRAVPHDLRSVALIASPTFSPAVIGLVRGAMALAPAAQAPAGVRMTEHLVSRSGAGPAVRVLVFERAASTGVRPALLWIHGGGYVIGTPEQDMAFVAQILDRLDILIVSVDYRLAPEHPFPAPLDDCHAALHWLAAQIDALRVDPGRIAIGGQSAGGGLAAALVQRVVDDGPIVPAFQLLVYPMLDAATTARTDHGGRGRFVWTPGSNRFGWASYLGRDPTIDDDRAYAVPARRADLTGLPPAWIGVGTLDLFHDEDIEYGRRLRAAGVPCTVHVADGGYHAFDLMNPHAAATVAFRESLLATLAERLDAADAASRQIRSRSNI